MQTLRQWRTAMLAVLGLHASLAIAAPLQPPLDAYGDLPSVEDMAISPNGKGLAVAGQFKGVRQLVVLDSERKIRAIAPLEGQKLSSIEWAGEDMVIVVVHDTKKLDFEYVADKYEFFGGIMVPLDGSKVQMIFSKSPSMFRAIFGNHGIRFIDGKWAGFYNGVKLRRSSDRVNWVIDDFRPALFKVDIKDNSPLIVARAASEGHWRDWLVDGGGRVAGILDVSSVSGKWEILNERGETLASGIDRLGKVELIAFGRDGTTAIYAIEDDAAVKTRWFEIPLAGGSPIEILADLNIERSYIDPTNGRLMGYLERGAKHRPILFDPAKQAILAKVYRAFPKLDVDIIQWTPDMGKFLVRTSGNDDSGTWYVVDIAKRNADPVGIERPRIPPDQVGPISTLNYNASDGTELDGILTLPPGREAKNLPVVIFPHGGPHSDDEEQFHWWAQAFASRGYVVFQPNFRGSTNRDHAFMRAGYGQWGRKMQTDISDGLAALVREGIADPKRACIMGASYGGYAALAGVTLQQGLYRCAVSVAGVSDLTQMYNTENRESGNNMMLIRNLKESLGDPRTFNAVSPRRSAAKADAPILLIHGRDDTVVAFEQSDSMADALRSNGKPYKFITLKEEDHWLSRAATRKQMLEEAMSFIQQNNPAD
jgi:dienelactone hydrolase